MEKDIIMHVDYTTVRKVDWLDVQREHNIYYNTKLYSFHKKSEVFFRYTYVMAAWHGIHR